MADKYLLMKESEEIFGEFEEHGIYETESKAEAMAGELFDEGFNGNFIIKKADGSFSYMLKSHQLAQNTCPICEKKVRAHKMLRTFDCHGIPFRMVCEKCYDRIMNTKGYDGERYSELDECLDYDY